LEISEIKVGSQIRYREGKNKILENNLNYEYQSRERSIDESGTKLY
jgi:hypothetical protein